FLDGRYAEALGPGRYAFWKHGADVRLVRVDRRETVVDVPGQDILTADKVTLRLTAVVVYRVADPLRSGTHTDDAKQALYREAASLRHQANAAKLLAENPTLQRLRELEAVEKIAAAGKLKVVLGEKGLADRVVNLL